MNHMLVFFIPLLMFADYYLTIYGAKLRNGMYANHFTIKEYELNPLWQKDIAKLKMINMKHIVLVIVFTGTLYFAMKQLEDAPAFLELIYGALFILYMIIIGRHISNIMVFKLLIKRPELIEGQVKMEHELVLYMSKYQMMIIVLPFLITALFVHSWFVWGGLISQFIFLIIQGIWGVKYKKKYKRIQ